ncbi:APH family phosphotransferase [Natrialba magadii ATCC 43099]|uniref:APH family phosphotransferase n=1 Tax=Natrialba magadii (strain ATCC 43099 / DSM 3394 / CCM 3739 / CIP 104546 / IAM 13178 / JCM 8861 / NBRC 102185 / NCIMB 2190 / MS3) TaxID=547559 RepID=D3SYI6_NATMM|nr:phosphotransferase [Natrialba magadii]ADD04097.1 APH family phosphotransferase [Natrialba magadii ATCC 43099]ELY33254.1 aminoglycoside phosphotransferase [Natrialba magadii ATCC 43099]
MEHPGDESIRWALDDTVPERAVNDVRSAGPSWNDQNRTVRVDFSDGEPVFLKVATDGDGSRIDRECAVIDYVATHCDVPVPQVVASETGGAVPYLITAPIRGQNLASRWSDWSSAERTSAVRRVGSALAAIHTCSFRRHGHVVGSDGAELDLETGSWTEILVDRIELMRELASTDRFDHHFDDVIAAVEANRDLLNDAPATLVHGDPARPNCFRSGSSAGFVDWELSHVGDPARELHRARDQLLPDNGEDTQRLAAVLEDGYERRAGSLPSGLDERTPIYDAVRLLGTSGFFDKWVEFVDVSPADAETRLEAKLDRKLDEIR